MEGSGGEIAIFSDTPRTSSRNTGEVMAFVTFRTLFVISFTVIFPAGGAAISRMLTATMFASPEM